MKAGTDSQDSVLNYSLNLLSYRPRSEHEIRFRLERKKISPELIDQTFAKLKELGLLDDAKFVQWWQKGRDEFKPRSARILRLELAKKGVPREIIAENLDGSFEKETERVNAAFAKKFKRPDHHDRERIIRFLASRGFSWDLIQTLLSENLR